MPALQAEAQAQLVLVLQPISAACLCRFLNISSSREIDYDTLQVSAAVKILLWVGPRGEDVGLFTATENTSQVIGRQKHR